jgi:hypothetical protein
MVALAAVTLGGCAVCCYDGYGTSPAASSAAPSGSARRAARTSRAPPPTQAARGRVLKPRNAAKFAVLPDVEAVGRSRSYSGGQTDPDSCAEQCLASGGCDAFSFEKSTRLCYLVMSVTELTVNASFISGRAR